MTYKKGVDTKKKSSPFASNINHFETPNNINTISYLNLPFNQSFKQIRCDSLFFSYLKWKIQREKQSKHSKFRYKASTTHSWRRNESIKNANHSLFVRRMGSCVFFMCIHKLNDKSLLKRSSYNLWHRCRSISFSHPYIVVNFLLLFSFQTPSKSMCLRKLRRKINRKYNKTTRILDKDLIIICHWRIYWKSLIRRGNKKYACSSILVQIISHFCYGKCATWDMYMEDILFDLDLLGFTSCSDSLFFFVVGYYFTFELIPASIRNSSGKKN